MLIPVFNTGDGLEDVLPGASYRGLFEENTEEEYNALEWTDIRPKPSWLLVEQAALKILISRIKANINLRTDEIILHDFRYSLQPNTPVEMTAEWQRNILGMYMGESLHLLSIIPVELLTYPYDLHSGSDEYGNAYYVTIPDFAGFTQLYLEIFVFLDGTLAGGRVLKTSLVGMTRTQLEEFRDLR